MKILSQIETVELITKNPKRFNVISILDDEYFNIDSAFCKYHLFLSVSDDLTHPLQLTLDQFHLALDFDKQYKVDIVHCYAGFSRSPALAYGLLRGRGLSAADAMKKVDEITDFLCGPNENIVRLVDRYFNAL
jgi:predicted protein tyrosine phosphatase